MPRPTALTRITVPVPIQPIKLSDMRVGEFATLLGSGELPDVANETLAWIITYYGFGSEVSAGHTAQRMEAELSRIAKRLRGGERAAEILRSVTDPWFGQDYGTHVRLARMAADPKVPTPHLYQAVETRRGEVATLRPVKPKHAMAVLTAAYALLVWGVYAVGRGDSTRQWQFVLAVLEACGHGTEGLRRTPKRLLRDLGRLPELTRGG